MNNKKKTILGIIAFALFIGIAAFAYNTLSKKVTPNNDINIADKENDEQGEEPEVTKAPDFTVLDKDGKEVTLSQMTGKPMVVNFWASWCPPCKSEMPIFNSVYEEMGEDVVFLMVDMVDGQRETKEIGEQYIREQNYTFPVYFDTKQEASTAYSVYSLPTTVFIDKDGNLVTGVKGAIDEETLRKGISMIKGGA